MQKSSYRRALLAGVALALAVSAGGIAQAQDMQTVRVLLPNENTTNLYPVIVARELGFCADEGLNVEYLSSNTTVPYVAFLANGQADLTMLDAPQTFQAVNTGQPISVIYKGMQYAPEAIGVGEDSPIQSVGELEGKTIGLASDRDRTTTAIFLDTAGVSIDDVQTVVVGATGPVLANALKNQTVDAVAAAVNDFAAVQGAGVTVRNITPEEVQQNPANSFVVWNDRKEELRPILEKYLRCWTKGNEAAEMDRDVVAALSRASVPEEWENEEAGQTLLDASIKTNVSITEKTGDLQPDVWNSIQAPYVKFGMIDQEIDATQFLDNSFVDAANDFDRAEVKAALDEWRAANPDALQAQ
jgi:NitT/TauT family transport system substrate-binding protein